MPVCETHKSHHFNNWHKTFYSGIYLLFLCSFSRLPGDFDETRLRDHCLLIRRRGHSWLESVVAGDDVRRRRGEGEGIQHHVCSPSYAKIEAVAVPPVTTRTAWRRQKERRIEKLIEKHKRQVLKSFKIRLHKMAPVKTNGNGEGEGGGRKHNHQPTTEISLRPSGVRGDRRRAL